MANSELQSFGNEQSLDWLSDLLDEDDIYFVHNTLEIIADYPPDESPDVWDCNCAVAAAEIVAAIKGNPCDDLPPPAVRWLQKHPMEADEELMDLVTKAIGRIEARSELKLFWDEAELGGEWQESLADLRVRLGI